MPDKSNRKALNRLVLYQAYLSINGKNSIAAISGETGIPIEIVRKDFGVLLNNKYFQMNVSETTVPNKELVDFIESKSGADISEDYSEVFDLLSDSEVLKSDGFQALIRKGVMDDAYFEIPVYSDDFDDELLIPVEQDEFIAYMDLFGKSDKELGENPYFSSGIRYKKYLHSFDSSLLDKLRDIEDAILGNTPIKFLYKSYFADTVAVNILPSKIGFDATTNRYVVISATDIGVSVFDLDYIVGKISTASIKARQKPELLARASKVWGFEFDECFDKNMNFKKPMHVKIQFYNEANVISKVYRDLAFRHDINVTETDDGGLIYEDDVYGKESFIRWLMSFGSSVKILAPKSLISDYLHRI